MTDPCPVIREAATLTLCNLLETIERSNEYPNECEIQAFNSAEALAIALGYYDLASAATDLGYL